MGSLFESQRDGAAGSGRHRNDYWEPDVPTPDALLNTAIDTMQRAKTTYSDGRGEAGLRSAQGGVNSINCVNSDSLLLIDLIELTPPC